ncbi:hypothetical protein AB0K48_18320 [Nonomuraea sp. NPDC055795]
MSELVIQVDDPSIDPSQLADLTDELRRSLLDLDVDDVRFAGSPAPPGTRGTEALELAVVVVQFVAESGLIASVVQTVSGWLARSRVHQVEITLGEDKLVLSNASADEQRRLVEHFIKATGEGTAAEA